MPGEAHADASTRDPVGAALRSASRAWADTADAGQLRRLLLGLLVELDAAHGASGRGDR